MKFLFVPSLAVFACLSVSAQEDTLKKTQPDSAATIDRKTSYFTVSAGDLDDETESQDVSGLLQSSRDAFTSVAGFNWGNARYRIRGYNGENTVVLINGIPVNDPESGFASWTSWGGLNDVTRYMEVKTGLQSGDLTFGGVAGFTSINTRASSYNKGIKGSYALSNRTYAHRVMGTYTTGMTPKGYALAFSMSGRYSNEGYVEGTHFRSMAYFLAAEKKMNDEHSINLTVFGAPVEQGRQSIAVQEAYDLSLDNYYNSFWGYQAGKKRNSRVSTTHRPTAILTHYFTPSQKTKIQTSLFFQGGRNSLSSLNWFDAKDPRPDYYKYLPSYYAVTDPAVAAGMQFSWTGNENVRQINWDALYNANYNNLYTLYNANGIAGNTVNGVRSKYIVENQHSDTRNYGLNSVLHTKIGANHLMGGVNVMIHQGLYYKKMADLMGGDFWVDVDRFAEQQAGDPNIQHNDISIPNHMIEVGDKFGYDYIINVNKYEVFGTYSRTFTKFDVYGSLQGGLTSFWRNGIMVNGKFPETSGGNSEKQNLPVYGIKGGATWKITGRHFVSANAAYITRSPETRSAFISPRTRNDMVKDITTEKVLSADLNYTVRYSFLKMRLTGYYTQMNDQLWLRTFYHDGYNNFVNYVMRDVDQVFYGIEAGVEATFFTNLVVTGVFATGDFLYNNRPLATITRDNLAAELATDKLIYLKNYHIGGMPETAASLGIKYNGKKFWFAGFNVNYYSEIYAEVNPDRRTEEAVDKYVTVDPQWNQILDQEKLPDGFTVDLYAGKSIKIKKSYLNINLSVNNLLDISDFKIYGTEQLRYDANDINKFPNKYAYHLGRTFFAMITWRF